MYVLLTLSACAVGTVTIIIDTAWYRRLSHSLVSFGWMKPMTVASFKLVGYV